MFNVFDLNGQRALEQRQCDLQRSARRQRLARAAQPALSPTRTRAARLLSLFL